MTYTYIFSKELTEENVQQFIDDTLVHKNIDVFFSGPGGGWCNMKSLAHYINGRQKDFTFYVDDVVGSASALLVLKYLKCKVVLTEDLGYMVLHRVDRQGFKLRATRAERFDIQQLVKVNEEIEKWLKGKVEKKSLQDHIEGRDVEITRDELVSKFLNSNISAE